MAAQAGLAREYEVAGAPLRVVTNHSMPGLEELTVFRVRRDKAALIQRVQAPPGERSSRKQLGQAWR